MIGRLRGVIAERGLDGSVVLDVGGVGYEVFVPLGSHGRLPHPPEEVVLHVHTHVREDALVLYGFAAPSDRAAFRTILGVSGVGPKLAMAVLSALDADRLAQAVASGDRNVFKGIPGVGKKTAERLLLELKDKLPELSRGKVASGAAAAPPAAVGPLATVSSVLVGMGFKPAEAESATSKLADIEGKSIEDLLREALGHLG